MDDFRYADGELWCENVPATRLAAEIGTPAYAYSRATLTGHYQRLSAAFAPLSPAICYSIKSCPNTHICRLLAELGSGFDVVSGGELFRARRAGADPAKIVFAGVGKRDDELRQAIEAEIGLFNIESEPELWNLDRLARAAGRRVRAAVRVNPDVDAHTHRHTTTGTKETKFGLSIEATRALFERCGADGAVDLCGLHLHLGSPVNSVEPYVRAIERLLALMDELRSGGRVLDTLDIGGGFGAHYRGGEAPGAAAYAEAVVPLLRHRDLKIVLEPGRSIIANAGILLARVEYVKQAGTKRFVILDAGMNDLIRPALYDAYHFIWPVKPAGGRVPASRDATASAAGLDEADIVGPVCETADCFARARPLPAVERGDLVAIFTAGAYGMAMTSQYNSRPRPVEVLVDGDRWRIIRRRETYEDLVTHED